MSTSYTPRQIVFTNHKVRVSAPVNTIWKVFIEKIRRPDKYVPGVVKVEVVKEISPLAIERRMETATGQVISEIISADEITKTVIFKHNQDKFFSGIVTNTIYEENDGKDVFIEIAMTWSLKKPDSEVTEDEMKKFNEISARMTESIKGAVNGMKDHCEKLVQQEETEKS